MTVVSLRAAMIAIACVLAVEVHGAAAEDKSSLVWLEKPSAEQVNAVYPLRALRQDVEGAASLRCLVTVDGKLTECAILTETPEGYEFGAAALKLTSRYKMPRLSPDGQSVAGASVTLRIPFKLEEPAGAAAIPGSRNAPISITRFADLFSYRQVPHVFPERAIKEERAGKAQLLCKVSDQGHLTDCSVLAESSKGFGFGKAALELSRYAELKLTLAERPLFFGKWITYVAAFDLE